MNCSIQILPYYIMIKIKIKNGKVSNIIQSDCFIDNFKDWLNIQILIMNGTVKKRPYI